MGANGDITMTNLKGAVPHIADDRLSAFNPAGAGNPTSFGDFLVDGLGRNTDADPTDIDSNLIRPHSVENDENKAAGSFDNNDYWVFSNDITLDPITTDKFVVEIDLAVPGEFFAEQIGNRLDNWNFAVVNCSVDNVKAVDSTNDGLKDQIHLECTVTGYGAEGGVEARFGDGMNTDATNYNASSTGTPKLVFLTQDWEPATPRIAYSGKQIWFDDSGSSGQGHEWAVNIADDGTAIPGSDVLFDPEGQVDLSNSTWELFKNGTSRGTTSGPPGFTFFVSETEASGGDDWKLTLHDQNNNFVDAVVWTWGDSSAPYDDGGDPAAGAFSRDTDDAATDAGSPEPCSVDSHTLDDPNSPLA